MNSKLKYVILSLAILLAGTTGADAQSTGRVREKLLIPNADGARVIVNECGDTGAIVSGIEATIKTRSKVMGYRVRIFFDNSQNARGSASAVMNSFKEMYPDIPAYPSYDEPYFKVTVGNCLTREEATILWGKIKENFDKAFMVKEEIPLSVFTE